MLFYFNLDNDDSMFGKKPSDFPNMTAFVHWLVLTCAQRAPWGFDGSVNLSDIKFPLHPFGAFLMDGATGAILILLELPEYQRKLNQLKGMYGHNEKRICERFKDFVRINLMGESAFPPEMAEELVENADYLQIITIYYNEVYPYVIAKQCN